MLKEEARVTITGLVAKYEQVVKNGKLKSYSEEETKKDFILPMFKALGWDVDNKEEVSAEEALKLAGRSDYGFYLNGWPKFYLEAKKLNSDIHSEVFAKQAIRYSWNRGITWAILTDFESLIVFNAQDIDEHLSNKLFFDIPHTQYLERFDQLWWLSKESFENSVLDQEGERVGKKLQKLSVTTALYKDLNECREMLTKSLRQWNREVNQDLIDEGVQKLLDRLIFIRVAEDREIEQPTLVPLIRAWSGKENLYESMVTKFRELDKIYNSNLFSPHPFEKWEEYDTTTQAVIKKLYGRDGYYEYDFKYIPADILGTVYENYLGYKFAQSQKNEEVSKDAQKRKEQGIYYTPSYVVSYIVTNALKPVLDKCKTIDDLLQVKVLDPACGSGSFLLKALDVLTDKYIEFGLPDDEKTKLTILLNNLFGVDLDEQAVEIARLNLLINSLKQRTKLPGLENNIKNGNSLISGTVNDLEKFFGKKYRDKKAFNWKEEFPEVFDRENPGFDVVIGNPPYISFYSKQSQANSQTSEELTYYINNYDFIEDKDRLGRFNTLMFFFEIATRVLRESGKLGFIVDTNLHSNPSRDIRKYLKNYQINIIVDELHAFDNVASSQIILCITKAAPKLEQMISWYKFSNGEFIQAIASKAEFINADNDYSFKIPVDSEIENILAKVKLNMPLFKMLGKTHIRTCITFTGKKTYFVRDDKAIDIDYPLLEGSKSLSGPYCPFKWNHYIRYDTKLRDKLNKLYEVQSKQNNKRSPMVIGLGNLEQFTAPKIFIRLSDTKVTASFTNDFVAADLSLYIVTLPNLKLSYNDVSLLALLALFNSKLITYYMTKSNLIRNLGTGTPQIRLADIRNIPFPNLNAENNKELSRLAQIMLDLNRDLDLNEKDSNQWNSLKSEIRKFDQQINKLVYKIYALSSEEANLVEDSI